MFTGVHDWLARRTKDGKFDLEEKMNELKAMSTCNNRCKVLITSINVFRVVAMDNLIMLHTREQNTRCQNHKFILKNSMRCAVCDARYGTTFMENEVDGKKENIVKLHSLGCNQMLDICFISTQLISHIIYGVIYNGLKLAKILYPTEYTWSTQDMVPLTTKPKFNNKCENSYKTYKEALRSPECTKICEDLFQEVISPNPMIIDSKWIYALETIYGKFGAKEDQDSIAKIKTDNVWSAEVSPLNIANFDWKPQAWPDTQMRMEIFTDNNEQSKEKAKTIKPMTGLKPIAVFVPLVKQMSYLLIISTYGLCVLFAVFNY